MKTAELTGSTLAYLGDAVWSLLVREYLIEQGYTKAKDLQVNSINYVSAKSQVRIFRHFEEVNYFDEKDLEIYRRGRNFKSDSIPKNTDVKTYRSSTGFEALIGFWYIEHRETKLVQFWEEVKTWMGE